MPAPATVIEAVVQRLLDPGVTALVGQRVFPSKPTQDSLWPYVVATKTAGGDEVRLDGPAGLQGYSVRLDCYAKTEAEAEAVLAAAAARLDRWRDRANGVQGCFPQGDADEEVLDDGSQVSGQTFTVWFKAQ